MFKRALVFCELRHRNQLDRDMHPHYEHCMRVAEKLSSSELQTIGLLHDILEDTETTYEELKGIFGQRVADAVLVLTHYEGESYDAYITRVLCNADARQVKIADILDNLHRSRLSCAEKKRTYDSALARLVEDPVCVRV